MNRKHLALLTLLACGCAIARTAMNEPLDPALIEKLEPGKTTALETVELMGAPVDVVQLGRRSAYLYKHTREKSTGIVLIVFNMLNQDHREDRLWVFFDEAGTLTHFGSTLESDRTKVATPFKDLYKEDEAPTAAGEEKAPPKDAPQEKTAS
ncbi:MAG: hypothetical protein ACYTG3_15340 [Planctomycetota bacterium]|jgi:hypothetical protein